MAPEERSAINDLTKNSDIVIKETDKVLAIVVMYADDYLAECHRQLDNRAYYLLQAFVYSILPPSLLVR